MSMDVEVDRLLAFPTVVLAQTHPLALQRGLFMLIRLLDLTLSHKLTLILTPRSHAIILSEYAI
jgi:hypothetical protein